MTMQSARTATRFGVVLWILLAAWPCEAQRPGWEETLIETHGLDDAEAAAVDRVLAGSRWIGQGNAAVTKHPMTPEQCRQARAGSGQELPPELLADDARICGGPHMAPLYDPATQSPADAKACIDRYEFPDVPCEYPVVWTRASEAAALCEAVGKRLCDAHEWEGACEGSLQPPDYRFDLAKGLDANAAVNAMRKAHNAAEGQHKTWAYGEALGVSSYTKGVCGGASTKAADCNGGDYNACGSNTYPAGSFPRCVSALGVYDLHGNAAEHMNLPLTPDQMAGAATASPAALPLGVTEMKGSWFIFDSYYAHEDWCRWRAPYWHGSRVRDAKSHHNYHLGFRCCKTVADQTVGDEAAGGDPPSPP